MSKTPVLVTSAFLVLASVFLFGTPPAISKAAKEEKLPPGYAGVQTCEGCHEEVVKNLKNTPHGRLFLNAPRNEKERLACEACHGPGQEHADSGGAQFGQLVRFSNGNAAPTAARNQTCLQCHQKGDLLFWQGGAHDLRDVGCSSCHNVHKGITTVLNRKLLGKPTVQDTCQPCHQQQVAQQLRFSHHPLREGKMDCASCHNPHGTVSEDLLKANSLNQLCFSCHPEKRGPFLYEHPPVQEDCSNCHVSHGSNYVKLLKTPEIRSCRQCHINFHGGDGPNVGSLSRRSPRPLVGRICTDCHYNIHGSNHPSGTYFTR